MGSNLCPRLLCPATRTGATYYHPELELPGKGRVIKGLVVLKGV